LYQHVQQSNKFQIMTIAFDAKRLFQNFTGLGNYSRTLVRNLNGYYPQLHCQLYAPKVVKHPSTLYFIDNPNFEIITPEHRFASYWRTFGIKSDLIKKSPTIFHGLSHEIPMGIQKLPIKKVVTIHDLVFKVYPEYTPAFQRYIYDFKFRYACENSDIIIAISEQTKNDIIKFYDINPEKIKVIYQTCGNDFQNWEQELPPLNMPQIPSEFMLYVGSVIERKNLLRIIEAMSILPKSCTLPLVVIGNNNGKYAQQVKEKIKKEGLENRVVWIEKIIYEQLPALYRAASLFLYPSEYEGFGIPVIEGLFSKVPVITSNVSCLPEAGGQDSLLINPASSDDIADAILKGLTDNALRTQMIAKGFDYANKNFAAGKVTTDMCEVYHNLLKN
jgi:glycosyltransferase involved in cell wall biosynthesis